jgi:hypothetical protein
VVDPAGVPGSQGLIEVVQPTGEPIHELAQDGFHRGRPPEIALQSRQLDDVEHRERLKSEDGRGCGHADIVARRPP